MAWRRLTRGATRALALMAGVTTGAAKADLPGDAEAGKDLYAVCSACHQVGVNARDRVGPHLNGIFGRRAAAHDGYRYSASMERAGTDGLVWTFETLDAYIENPRALVSRTRMSFRGMHDPEDRVNLLAYLQKYSDSAANAHEAQPKAQPVADDLDPAILDIEGDAEYGEYLATECLTCHKADGSADGIPSITRWPEEAFVIVMHEYKNKVRPNPVMQMMAGRLTNEEIAALAAYFSTLR